MSKRDFIPVVGYLQKYSFSDLNTNFGIKVKEYDNIVVLNYDQISTPKTDPRWWDCRGLILDKNSLDILCRPFTRFFNFKETFESAEFCFERSIIQDKVDGSLSPIWYNPYDGMWYTSTRGMAYGEGKSSMGNTFHKLFLDGLKLNENEFQNTCNKNLDKSFTYICEMVSPETRVVTPYEDKAVYFLAARHNVSGYYTMPSAINYEMKATFNYIKFPNEYDFNDSDAVIKMVNNLSNLEEGVVCFDPITGNRVKIKSSAYVNVHHIRDNGVLVPRRIMALVRDNEYSEYLSYFPNDKIHFDPYIRKYDELKEWIRNTYEDIKDIESQKNFALEAIKTPFSSILFEMRKGKLLKEILEEINVDKLLEIIDMLK